MSPNPRLGCSWSLCLTLGKVLVALLFVQILIILHQQISRGIAVTYYSANISAADSVQRGEGQRVTRHQGADHGVKVDAHTGGKDNKKELLQKSQLNVSLQEGYYHNASLQKIQQSNVSLTKNLQTNVSLHDKQQTIESLQSSHHDGALLQSNFTLKVRNCKKPSWKSRNGTFVMARDQTEYFTNIGENKVCLTEGTNLAATGHSRQCVCKKGWYGDWCSVPHVVQFSNYNFTKFPVKPRLKARSFVSAFPFNLEFPMLDARFGDLGDLVDVFMILESNYTAYGKPKPLYLLDKLKSGKYSEVACKILHIFLPYFPKGAHDDGWIADNLHRNYIGEHGVVHQLQQVQHDDIFWLSDADEIPSRETVLFLKVHDGFSEPIGIFLKRSIYGFFWQPSPTAMHITAGVTFAFLSHVLYYRAIEIRSRQTIHSRRLELNTYLKSGALVNMWSVGNRTSPAGWHCSWCGPPEFIRNKLISAQNGDFPRWGDYPKKVELKYISGLIQKGMWFDDRTKMLATRRLDPLYAPPYILNHPEKYKYYLTNPYVPTPHTNQSVNLRVNFTQMADH